MVFHDHERGLLTGVCNVFGARSRVSALSLAVCLGCASSGSTPSAGVSPSATDSSVPSSEATHVTGPLANPTDSALSDPVLSDTAQSDAVATSDTAVEMASSRDEGTTAEPTNAAPASDGTSSSSASGSHEGSRNDTSAASSDDSEPSLPQSGIVIQGRAIYVDGVLFHIKGVNWNPVAKGGRHPDNLDYAGFADQDIALMRAAGINVVRTYERLDEREVLDKLHAAGIYVLSTVLGWWQDDVLVVTERVNDVKDHPAILGWVLGNEWNYNQLYSSGQMSTDDVRDRINQAASLIKAADSAHPVVTVYGEIGDIGPMIEAMPDIDIWGINAYRGKDHSALIAAWPELSDKPMFISEYGGDAWDSRNGGAENTDAQAEAATALTQQIIDAYTTTNGGGITSGGCIFEWADEWWKSAAVNPTEHDTASELTGGVYPDGVFNEEWWGIVDIDRNPRPAYAALEALYAP